ncbi:MAG: EAL domain-containing protein, partial [Burkholderiales bacterium]|nr:EAL domain-containing protein [Burkholderiales bacterium]
VARQIQPNVEEVLQAARTSAYERQLPGADGAQRWIEVSLVPHRQGDGPVMGAFVLINDITRHRAAEAAVRQSEERMAKFMAASVEGIVFHKDGLITDANAPIAALVGLTPEALRGRHVFEFVAPAQQARVGQVMAQGAELSYETEIVDAQGQAIPVEFIVRTLPRGDDKLRMTVVRDLRDRHATQASIRRLARQDTLTQLDNRGSFMQRLAAALAVHRRGVLALYFIDLDHFKRINDSLGHVAGDALLRSVADRIVALLPPEAAAGRFGGDEFVVMVPGLADRQAARDWAERLRAGVRGPVAFEGRSIAVTSTIGVALHPADGGDADHLLRHADAALYGGKAAGRDTVCFFEPAMGEAIAGGMQLEARLGDALARGEFELLLQPRVDAASGRVTAVQALARWRHPQRGLLAPADFADVPGPRRVLRPVTDWALHDAARLARSNVMRGLPIVLDLASLHPHGMALSAMVGQVFTDPRIAPGVLGLGLNERLSADEAPVLRRLLAQLAEHGAPAWLEGFGGAGVALAALRGSTLAGLTLDRAIVAALPSDPAASAIARAVLQLARGLGLGSCAAGVDTAEQQAWLRAEGCAWLQGAAIAPPMPAAALSAWLAARA